MHKSVEIVRHTSITKMQFCNTEINGIYNKHFFEANKYNYPDITSSSQIKGYGTSMGRYYTKSRGRLMKYQ
ncbi:MAG: hypothetical protein LWX56_15315 [Ignavibacteria bacterium]|nr:hypothetical protein [Ignavibacteria bacterium]